MGDLGDSSESSRSPLRTGFFDIEAIKRAAAIKGLQVIDVEPKADYRESELPAFLAGCGWEELGEGKTSRCWLKGFLVYDSRPGHARHFYAIVTQPRHQFALLNSLTEEFGIQNRLLTESELWQMHEFYAPDFKSWEFRWFPVVSVQDAALALQDCLQMDDPSWSISTERAEAVIQSCRWRVAEAATQLLQADVRSVLQHFRAGRLVIPRSAAQAALEAAEGDAEQAAEKLAEMLRTQAASEVPEDSIARRALNAAGWSIDRSVTLLELAGNGASESFEALRDILQRVDWQFDKAVKVREVLAKRPTEDADAAAEQGTASSPKTGHSLDVDTAAALLKACTWNVEEVARVGVVQRGYPQCPVPIIRNVLQRNDGDTSAALEMLKDFQERVGAQVMKCARSCKLPVEFDEVDLVSLGEAALERGSWSPTAVLNHVPRLIEFAAKTKVLCGRLMGPGSRMPAPGILWALQECGDERATPEVVTRMLLHGEDVDVAAHNARHFGCRAPPQEPHKAQPGYAKAQPKLKMQAKAKAKRASQQEESSCMSIM